MGKSSKKKTKKDKKAKKSEPETLEDVDSKIESQLAGLRQTMTKLQKQEK